MGFFGEPQREHHDQTGQKQEDRGGLAAFFGKACHHKGVAVGAVGHEVAYGIKSGKRHTDEVHQVVAGKRESKREGAAQNDDSEDVEVDCPKQNGKQNGQSDEERQKDGGGIGVDPRDPFGLHEAGTFGAFHDEEVEDGREAEAAEDAADAAIHGFKVEGKEQTHQVLHDHARDEGNAYGNQDT